MRRGLSIDPQIDPEVTALFRRMIKWLIIVNIVLGLFTLVNLYIYPQHIYEPVLYSKPANQLHPYEI